MKLVLVVLSIACLLLFAFRARADVVDLQDSNPLVIEDARPQGPGLQVQVSGLNAEFGAPQAEAMLLPELQYGTQGGLELGLGAELGVDSRSTSFEAHVLAPLVDGQALGPSVALRAGLVTPQEAEGMGGRFDAIVTQPFGRNRVHANARFEPKATADDDLTLALGADRQLGEKVLLAADVAGVNALGTRLDPTWAAEVGAIVELTERLQLQGAGGAERGVEGWRPRLLLGVSADL